MNNLECGKVNCWNLEELSMIGRKVSVVCFTYSYTGEVDTELIVGIILAVTRESETLMLCKLFIVAD